MKTKYFGVSPHYLRIGKGNWQILWLPHWHNVELRLGWWWVEIRFKIGGGRIVNTPDK
jgi:hypothetical protein